MLSYFDFGLLVGRGRRSLRPLDRFLQRLHLKNPVAADQLLRFGEWSTDPRFLSADRESDSRAFGTGVQTRRIDQNSRFGLLLVVLHRRGDRFLARHLAGF